MVLAAGRDLGDRQRAMGAGIRAEDGRDRVLGGHRARGAIRGFAVHPRRPGRSRRSARSPKIVDALGAERCDPLTGDELHEVAPVRADVSKRTRRAALCRVDAPVVVLRGGQPVLQVAAGDEPHGPERAGANTRARLAHDRVEPVDEGHGADAAGSGAERSDEARPPPRCSRRAASRRRRACRARARASRARRGSRWASRCGRRRRRRLRPAPAASRRRARRPGARPPRASARASTWRRRRASRAGQPRGPRVHRADEARRRRCRRADAQPVP